MSKEGRKPGRKRAGSRILLQIVVLVVIVFITSGVVSFLFFRHSQSTTIQKSKNKLIENRGNLMCSSNRYVVNCQFQIQVLSFPGSTPETIVTDIAAGVTQKTISPQQEIINEMLRTLIENGFWNSKLVFYAIPPISNINTTEPLIIMSSDNGTIYKEVPKVLEDLVNMKKDENKTGRKRFNADNSYMFFEDGIPELGLKGEYLVSAYRFKPESETWSGETWYYDFSSMHDQLAAIDRFFSTESKNINTTLILVMVGSIIALVIITFFVLNYLIRKKITNPIDELVDAAEKVMEGDFDAQVPVKVGEEFYGLKTAFNNMLVSLRNVINKSMGAEAAQTPWVEPDGNKEGKPEGKKRGGRSSILLPATVAIVIIFIISGGLSLLFFQRSLSTLVEKSKEQVVRSEAEGISSGHLYVSTLLVRYYAFLIPDMTSPESGKEIFNALKNRQTTRLTVIMNNTMKRLIDERFDGLEMVFYGTPGIPGIIDEPTILFGSNDKYHYQKLPGDLVKLHEFNSSDNGPYQGRLDEDNTYMLAKNGIPELGLKGKYLVMSFWNSEQATAVPMWFYDFKPMGKQLAEVDSFYSKESRNAIILMSIVTIISIIAVAIITLFVLSYLIKSRITKPVDELASIAEEVMEGNLEIEIPVSKGEEFESLKRAFNEMLKSLNELIFLHLYK